MILTYKPFGRLGNSLFLFAHLMAFADLHSAIVRDYAFLKYCSYFPYWSGGAKCQYGKPNGRKKRFLGSFVVARLAGSLGVIPHVRFWDERDIIFDGEDSNDPRVVRLRESELIIFEGWKLRSHEQITRSREAILSAFEPRADIREKVSKRIELAHDRGDKVLGVHVRWEDYRGTDRFFSLQEFSNSIESVRASMKNNTTVCIISSPEAIDDSQLPSNCIVLGGKDAVADLYTLASCDCILGPPSTFSGWASYYGERPLIVMRNHKQHLGIENAEIVRW